MEGSPPPLPSVAEKPATVAAQTQTPAVAEKPADIVTGDEIKPQEAENRSKTDSREKQAQLAQELGARVITQASEKALEQLQKAKTQEDKDRIKSDPGNNALLSLYTLQNLDQDTCQRLGGVSIAENSRPTVNVDGQDYRIVSIDSVDGDGFRVRAIDNRGSEVPLAQPVPRDQLVLSHIEHMVIPNLTSLGETQKKLAEYYLVSKKGQNQTAETPNFSELQQVARSMGMVVSSDIGAVAAKLGIVKSQPEIDALLGQTSQESKTVELSEQATKLQELLSDNPVLTNDQIKHAFSIMDIPYDQPSLFVSMSKNSALLQEKQTLLETAEKSNQGQDAIRLKKEIEDLTKKLEAYKGLHEKLSHYAGAEWNAVDSLVNLANSDTLPEGINLGDLIVRLSGDLTDGNIDAVLNQVIGKENMDKQDEKDQAKKFWKDVERYSLYGGGGVFGLFALMAYLGSKNKQQQ
ncbi:hypothetical protein GYA28_03410 [Candidatus Roizmanbacteria bacterium]|nr:hypothetical protein [Candidatus Roizmanbacteria bacterium]